MANGRYRIPETNGSHLKIGHRKRKLVYVSFREGNFSAAHGLTHGEPFQNLTVRQNMMIVLEGKRPNLREWEHQGVETYRNVKGLTLTCRNTVGK